MAAEEPAGDPSGGLRIGRTSVQPDHGFSCGCPPRRQRPRRAGEDREVQRAAVHAVIFHNALDIAEIVRQLQAEGMDIAPEDLAQVSPYLTEDIRRFGEYSTHELGDEPTEGFSQAT